MFKYLKTKTIQHSSITLLGTFLNGLLGLLFFMMLARNLNPADFGLISVAVAFLTLVADIADIGVNTGIINFVSKYWNENREKSLRFMKLGLEMKVLVGIIFIVIGTFFINFLANNIFAKPELKNPLYIALLGILSALLFSFVANSLQALQKFGSWSILNIFSNSLRLLLVFILVGLGLLSVNSSLIIYIAIPLIGFLVGLFLLPLSFLKVKNEKQLFNDFFSYNKWVALSIITAAISSRLDTFLSARFLSLNQIGTYSVASQLALIMPQAVYAIAAVVAPKLASFDTPHKAWVYLKKLQLLVVGLAVLGFLIIPLAFYLIPLFYGESYLESVWPFAILWIAQLLFLISIPAHQAIFYYFSKPKIFSVVSLINLCIVFSLGIILIPLFGVIGAALTIFIGSIVNFLLPLIWVLIRFKVLLHEKV